MKIYNLDNQLLFETELSILQIGSCFYHNGTLYQIKGIISTDLSIDVYVTLTDRNTYVSSL